MSTPAPAPEQIKLDQLLKQLVKALGDAVASQGKMDKCTGRIGATFQSLAAIASRQAAGIADLAKLLKTLTPDPKALSKVQVQLESNVHEAQRLMAQIEEESRLMTNVSETLKSNQEAMANVIRNMQ
jgi:hypothetical protein